MPVTKFEIKSRTPYAGGQSFGEVGAYEQVDGVVHFAVDPMDPANETIADIDLAPRNGQGLVEFTSDFRVLAPLDRPRGNRRLFLDILNRGKYSAAKDMNSAAAFVPGAAPDPGNGFLMRQGYTVAWCGWQFDVPEVDGILGIRVPGAEDSGGPIAGKIVVTFAPNAPANVQLLSDRDHRPYPANNLEDWDSVMTVQEHEDAPEEIIPRDQWSFARMEDGRRVPDPRHAYLEAGFQPGKVYQVVYTTTGAPVAGLGLLAIRDFGSFLRYGSAADGNPCAGNIEHAYVSGVSQSGRFLRLFLYAGVNRDEQGRTAFDGFIPHVAGGKRGEFNQRLAQPSSQAARSTNSIFPFSDAAQTDPETGLTDGVLSRLTAQGRLPKIMYTYTPSEYWAGHGSLVHTDLTGTRDVEVPDDVRIYVYASSQHGLGTFPLTDGDPSDNIRAQNPLNCLDHRSFMRAALTSLDRWVTAGEAPPPSSHPKIADGTAVPPAKAAETLRTIPGVNPPAPFRRFARLDFGPDPGVPTQIPAGIGRVFSHLVSAVDRDGNELGGIRLPFVTVPLATHTGWNTRHADMGGEGQTLSTGGASGGTLRGSTIPFPATREERQATGDPRLSVEERYDSREHYQDLIRQAAQTLVDQRYLLAEDVEQLVDLGGRHYDLLSSPVREAQPAGD
ncbi:MAG: hypothetical protein BZY80_05400 [SAR202 cluster bacterium Io17-Chloro-G2]|nr:MAG: hypothetical protein BZY80_05400 [SAR202 cluster bacterium Io17-Chloro-G2]